MKSIIIASSQFLLILTFAISCTHKQDTGQNGLVNESKEQKTETIQPAIVDEGEPTIASLTDEEIKTVDIRLGSIEQKQLTAVLKANGALRVPNNFKANATSYYGGVVKTINVQMGSFVKKGQVIATIANPEFIERQEEFLSLDSKITFAEQELARQKELNEGKAGALKNLQSAEAELKSLRTRKAALQQQIQLMGISPSSITNGNLRSALTVTSPISGSITNIFSKIGSYVDVSSPLAEIVDNAQLHVDLNIFEKDYPSLKVGQIIHFRITNNATEDYNAKIYSVGNAFENETKTIPVHAMVMGNKKGLIDGMNITAIVSLDNVTNAAVPNDAIVSANGKDYIFILTTKIEEINEETDNVSKTKEEEKETKNENKTEIKNFEKIEVVKGVSNLGYTAITPVSEIPKDAKVVVRGAFFVNAKLTNKGEE